MQVVTYSPSFTLVPTYECFNRCTYCNFRQDRGAAWLSVAEARTMLEPLRDQGITEILLLSGEVHPLDPRRRNWFQMLYDLAALALEMGFLPHTNAGILSFEEMKTLKEVNASMGLMLETCSENLLNTVHRFAPSKDPNLRLEQLDWAGQLQIAFTTGILLGIGETPTEREIALQAIAERNTGQIQEVILQPQRVGAHQSFQGSPITTQEMLTVVTTAREILGPTVGIQVPPNLVEDLPKLLAAGVTDLGGIGPVDVVNPDYDQPTLGQLRTTLESIGWQLRERWPVYPQYLPWLSPQVAQNLRVNG